MVYTQGFAKRARFRSHKGNVAFCSRDHPCLTSLLIGDIGGTNARFALTNHDMEGYHEERILKCADYESSESAISAFLEMTKAPAPTVICLAAAGPAKEGEVDLTIIIGFSVNHLYKRNSMSLMHDHSTTSKLSLTVYLL